MTDTPKSEAITFDEWWTEWNRCRCGLSDHARMSASNAWYRQRHALDDLLAKHERVLQMLEIAEKAVNRSRELFAYCAGPTRDVKTGKLLDGARICSDALAEIESLK